MTRSAIPTTALRSKILYGTYWYICVTEGGRGEEKAGAEKSLSTLCCFVPKALATNGESAVTLALAACGNIAVRNLFSSTRLELTAAPGDGVAIPVLISGIIKMPLYVNQFIQRDKIS